MIRPLASADFGAWEGLWNDYLSFYRASVSDEVTTATFARLVARTDGLSGLVVEDAGGDLVGFAHLVFHTSTWSVGPYCYLEDLFVRRSTRGTGTARELLDAVYEEADQRGASRTYWHTQEYNGAARSLYDQVAHRTSFVIYER